VYAARCGKDGGNREDDRRHRHRADQPGAADQRIEASKPEIGPPFEIVSVRPRSTVSPPSVHEGRYLEPGDGKALTPPASADDDGGEKAAEPAIALRARRQRDSVLAVPPLATTAATIPQKASSEPTREVDAGGEDDEGHAERDQPGD
jgi:hypothetical protein